MGMAAMVGGGTGAAERDAMMAVVVRGNGVALASDVLGVINKEHVADSVALSVGPYASIDGKA